MDVKMKKWIAVVVMCTLISCSVLTIPVMAAEQTVLLPSSDVTINAEYGTNYWFDFTLSDVPSAYYDVENGTYSGWCVDKDLEMSRGVNHQVILKSSFDTIIGDGFDGLPWHKINYIINHRDGYSRNNTQIAIWYFTNNVNISSYGDAQALVDAANENGVNYVPESGQKLAIPILPAVSWIQPAFLEIIIPQPSLQGFVWYDTNGDGIQDGTEEGIGGVTVNLYNSNNVSKGATQTISEGIYSFGSLEPGSYYLQFSLKSGHIFTLKDVGNDTLDSDADTTTGKTAIFDIPVNQEESITNWDAGMYKKSSGGTPSPPEEEPQKNTPPTADATVGEPYQGLINSTITFNGSRSYDLDGRIVSWRWNFGDGTNGTGETTTHTYALPRDYNVSLIVTDNAFAMDTYTTIAHITLGKNPPDIPEISGPISGHARVSSQYTVLSTDPDEDNLQYVIDWGDGQQETSPSVANGESYQFNHQWATPGFYTIQAYAKDMYNTSENATMTITIDVKQVGTLGYLIDQNGDSVFDKFHNDATGKETGVNRQTNGKYLIDSNGDGTYDLLFDTANGQTQPYSEQPLIMYLVIILAILIIVFLLIFYVMRKRKRPQQ